MKRSTVIRGVAGIGCALFLFSELNALIGGSLESTLAERLISGVPVGEGWNECFL